VGIGETHGSDQLPDFERHLRSAQGLLFFVR
jgi:hypothetical protein